MPNTLADWLEYQQRIHPREIELGLRRVREVWQRLGPQAPAPVTITVGGTNGKGSTVAFLEAMLAVAGKRVGAYTSPHLLRYNERVRIAGADAGDAQLIAAFERIEAARGDIPLTYFEFGTLAALSIFADSGLDVALLEVGLGGRLDAINIVDADAMIVTTVDLDHQDWLGNDRDAIGREKAGIFRTGRPAIIGDARPPRGLLDAAAAIGADLRIAGSDFQVRPQIDSWRWSGWSARVPDAYPETPPVLHLPEPALAAPCQIDNAAAAIAALYALRGRLRWDPDAIARGVRDARIAARLQRFPGPVELIVDVAHNPQAARGLAQWLVGHPASGRTIAVFSALADKDVTGIVAPLAAYVADWQLAGLARETPRGREAADLRAAVQAAGGTVRGLHADVTAALDAAYAQARTGDRILAFGSFFVAAAALTFAVVQGRNPSRPRATHTGGV